MYSFFRKVPWSDLLLIYSLFFVYKRVSSKELAYTSIFRFVYSSNDLVYFSLGPSTLKIISSQYFVVFSFLYFVDWGSVFMAGIAVTHCGVQDKLMFYARFDKLCFKYLKPKINSLNFSSFLILIVWYCFLHNSKSQRTEKI